MKIGAIKPTESEAEHWFCLWLRRLRTRENDSDFRFSLGNKVSNDSDSDSVASEIKKKKAGADFKNEWKEGF